MKQFSRLGVRRCISVRLNFQSSVLRSPEIEYIPYLSMLTRRGHHSAPTLWRRVGLGSDNIGFWARPAVGSGCEQSTQLDKRRFYGRPPAGEENSLSRDWFARQWVVDEKAGKSRRKVVKQGGVGRGGKDERDQLGVFLSSWSPFLKSFRSSLDAMAREGRGGRVLNEVFRNEKAPDAFGSVSKASGYSGGATLDKALGASQIDAAALSPKSPEEIKLAPLLARSDLLITRDIEWANLMFAFEQESRYNIVDPYYPHLPLGSIHEQSNVIYRQLLRTRRPFIAYIFDAYGNEIFRIRRPFWWINSTIYVEVNGKEIGVVHRRWHLWRRIYDLYLGKKQFAAIENPGFWNWTFTLKDEDDKVLAEINRDWRGLGLELFTDAGQYVIRFGPGASGPKPMSPEAVNLPELHTGRMLTLSERAVTVALAVSLDCDYFSRHGGWGMPIFISSE